MATEPHLATESLELATEFSPLVATESCLLSSVLVQSAGVQSASTESCEMTTESSEKPIPCASASELSTQPSQGSTVVSVTLSPPASAAPAVVLTSPSPASDNLCPSPPPDDTPTYHPPVLTCEPCGKRYLGIQALMKHVLSCHPTPQGEAPQSSPRPSNTHPVLSDPPPVTSLPPPLAPFLTKPRESFPAPPLAAALIPADTHPVLSDPPPLAPLSSPQSLVTATPTLHPTTSTHVFRDPPPLTPLTSQKVAPPSPQGSSPNLNPHPAKLKFVRGLPSQDMPLIPQCSAEEPPTPHPTSARGVLSDPQPQTSLLTPQARRLQGSAVKTLHPTSTPLTPPLSLQDSTQVPPATPAPHPANTPLSSGTQQQEMKTNHPHYKYKCQICSKTYKAKQILEMHRSLMHLPTQIYKCGKCFQSMDSLKSFKEHFDNLHSGPAMISAVTDKNQKSGEGFFISSNDTQCTKKVELVCMHCLKPFESEKTHFSDICLNLHCPVCKTESFKQISEMRNHMSLEHGPTCWVENVEAIQDEAFKIILQLKKHPITRCLNCFLCEEKNFNGNSLRKHVKMDHFGTVDRLRKHFDCLYCSFTCSRKGYLQKHMKKKHEYRDKMDSHLKFNINKKISVLFQKNTKSLQQKNNCSGFGVDSVLPKTISDDLEIPIYNLSEEESKFNIGESSYPTESNFEFVDCTEHVNAQMFRDSELDVNSSTTSQSLLLIKQENDPELTIKDEPLVYPEPSNSKEAILDHPTSYTVSINSGPIESTILEKKKLEEAEIKISQITKHPKYGFPCYLCSLHLSRKSTLRSHVVHKHLGIREFRCQYCGEEFLKLRTVKKHQEEVHANLPPNLIHKFNPNFQTPTGKFRPTITTKIQQTGLKQKTAVKQTALNENLKEAEKKVENVEKHPELGFKCFLCSKYLKKRYLLKYHVFQTHYKIKYFKCKYCDCKFSRSNIARLHHEEYHPELPLVFILLKPYTENSTNDEIPQETYTQSSTTIEITPSIPKMVCEDPDNMDDDSVICTLTEEENPSMELQDPKDSVERFKGNRRSKNTLPQNSPKLTKAQILERDNENIEHVETMLSGIIKDEVKGFQCYLCPTNYPDRCRLRNHILHTHLKIKQFSCEYCEETFYYKHKLREHSDKRHPDLPLKYARRHGRLYYDERFTILQDSTTDKQTEAEIIQSERLRINEELSKISQVIEIPGKGFKCYLCSTFILERSVFVHHVIRQHLGISQYKCGYCELKFDTVIEVGIHHRRIHFKLPLMFNERFSVGNIRGEEKKGFQTPCRRDIDAFKNKYQTNQTTDEMSLGAEDSNLVPCQNLIFHPTPECLSRDDFLVEQQEQIFKVTMKVNSMYPDTSMKGYKCYLCCKIFTQKHIVRRHVLQTHLKIPEFQCNYCDEKFFTRAYSRTHHAKFHAGLPLGEVNRFSTENLDRMVREKSTLGSELPIEEEDARRDWDSGTEVRGTKKRPAESSGEDMWVLFDGVTSEPTLEQQATSLSWEHGADVTESSVPCKRRRVTSRPYPDSLPPVPGGCLPCSVQL